VTEVVGFKLPELALILMVLVPAVRVSGIVYVRVQVFPEDGLIKSIEDLPPNPVKSPIIMGSPSRFSETTSTEMVTAWVLPATEVLGLMVAFVSSKVLVPAGLTLKVTVILGLKEPEVAVMLMAFDPSETVLGTVYKRVHLFPEVGLVKLTDPEPPIELKSAETMGSPTRFFDATSTDSVTSKAFPTTTELGEMVPLVRVKVGAGVTLKVRVVVGFKVPEVPEIVTLLSPALRFVGRT